MNDHFDHYTRPPSRDSSVDRYTRAASRLSGNSRQPSVDRNKPLMEPFPPEQSRNVYAFRSPTPVVLNTGNGSAVGPGTNIFSQGKVSAASSSNNQPPFEDFILRKRSLGQEIVPSPVGQPKRTESLHVPTSLKKEPQTKVSSQLIFYLYKI